MDITAFLKRYKYDPNKDMLGKGGFGKVYKAYDDFRDRYVAIKVSEVKHIDNHFSLQNEVDLNRSLPVHKNIAYYEECYRFELSNGTFDYGVLQFYEEGNLSALIKKNVLTQNQKLQIAEGIIQGLIFLKANSILHRDLKSENILISKKDDEFIPKITDFGLSKNIEDLQNSFVENSFVGGSLKYSAPEQFLSGKVKENVDVWSAGVILYELFTGRLPIEFADTVTFDKESTIENIKKLVNDNLLISYESIPEPYVTIIQKCLVVDPEKRLNNFSEIVPLVTLSENTSIIERNENPTKSKVSTFTKDISHNTVGKNKSSKKLIVAVFSIGTIVLGASGVLLSNFKLSKKANLSDGSFMLYNGNKIINNKSFQDIKIPLFGNIEAIKQDTIFTLGNNGDVLDVKVMPKLTNQNTSLNIDKDTKDTLNPNNTKNNEIKTSHGNKATHSTDAKRQTIIMGGDNNSPVIINPPSKSKKTKSKRKTSIVNGNIIIEN